MRIQIKGILVLSAALITTVIAAPNNGVLKDSRDGKTYKTVKIGNQTWMAENLNYETQDSYCYENNEANCEKYGRLYLWSAAMDSAGTWSGKSKGCGNETKCSPKYPVRGVCPSGWHLPTKTEFNTLFDAVGGLSTAGKMLKSISGWKEKNNGKKNNGIDAFGFSAMSVGYRNRKGGFSDGDNHASFWSSTEDDGSYAYTMSYFYERGYINGTNKDFGYSVRCLQD
jgi:uncharacterized protein (TIGR02145 family)